MTERPTAGGQYTRDEETGKLTLVSQTLPQDQAPPPAPKPKKSANKES